MIKQAEAMLNVVIAGKHDRTLDQESYTQIATRAGRSESKSWRH